MTTVTDILVEGARSRARIVVLDTGEYRRRTSVAALKMMQLDVGCAVQSHAGFESDLVTAERTACTERAYQLLGYRDRSFDEMRRSLASDGYPHDCVEAVIDRLAEFGYLDDEAYAGRYIRAALASKKGLRRIVRDLELKGVSRELIQGVLSGEPMVGTSVTEADNARYLASRWLPDSPSRQDVERVLRRLVSRGYSFEVARGALDSRFLDDSQ